MVSFLLRTFRGGIRWSHFPMRIFLAMVCGFLLAGCHKEARLVPKEPEVSYSREIRPLLAKNCMSCHTGEENATGYSLSLRDPKLPSTFFTPHPEGGAMSPEEEGLLLKWRVEGEKIDEHWAFGPLVPAKSWAPVSLARTTAKTNFPKGDFRGELTRMIAGDLLPDATAVIETEALRGGEDIPESRVALVSRMMGFPISEVSTENGVSEADVLRMKHIFTTPYDSALKSSLKPPTVLVGEMPKLPALEWADKPQDEEFGVWLAQKDSVPQMPDLVAAFSFDDGHASNLALGHFEASTFQLTETVEGISGVAVAAPKGVVLPDEVSFSTIQPFTLSVWVQVGSTGGVVPLLTQGNEQHGFYLGLKDGKPVARLSRFWPGNALGIMTEDAVIFPGRWSNITLTYDGLRKAAGLQIFVNGVALNSLVEADSVKGSIFSEGESIPAKLGGWASEGVALDEVQLYRRKLSGLEVRTLLDGKSLLKTFKSVGEATPELLEYYLSAVNQDARARELALLKNRSTQLAAENELKEVQVMESLPRAEAPEKARTSGLMCLDSVDRLGFVNALINEDGELLARAVANTVWEAHFGAVLVPDLSYGGSDLSRADDLDFLASKLIEFDWDLAKLSEFLSASVSP